MPPAPEPIPSVPPLTVVLPTTPPIPTPLQLAQCTVYPSDTNNGISIDGRLAKTTEDDIFDQLSHLCQLCIKNPALAATLRPFSRPAPSPSVTSPLPSGYNQGMGMVLCPHHSDSTFKHNRLETQPCVCHKERYFKGMSLTLTSWLITDAMQRP
jgi:hypothetical protein